MFKKSTLILALAMFLSLLAPLALVPQARAAGTPFQHVFSGILENENAVNEYTFSLPRSATLSLMFEHEYLETVAAWRIKLIRKTGGEQTIFDFTNEGKTQKAATNAIACSSGKYVVVIFRGWGDPTVPYTLTVNAKPLPKTIKTTYNANGGRIGSVKKQTISRTTNQKLLLPEIPYRSGYTFKGWYTKKSGGKKVSANTNAPKKNTTYYAHWKRNKY